MDLYISAGCKAFDRGYGPLRLALAGIALRAFGDDLAFAVNEIEAVHAACALLEDEFEGHVSPIERTHFIR
jgi:hypothetical protein